MSNANWNRRLNIVFTSLLSLILIFGVGTWVGYSFTGTTNTFAPGSLETTNLNVTGDYYRGTTNLTDRLLGTWGALISTTLDTGQGAYELYGMDQDMLTSSSPTFDDLTSASLDTGQGAYELYGMDQNVLTSSDPTFDNLTVTDLYVTGIGNYTSWIESENVPTPEAYDYQIIESGSTYYAYFGVNKTLAYTDTKAHDLVESIMSNEANGGHIKFGPQEFVIGEYLDLDACDSGWVSDDADVTVTHDAGVKVEGSASTKMVVAAGFGTGLMAHKELPSTIDGSAGDVIFWWARGTADIGSNKLSLKIDDATDCSSPYAINIEWFHTEDLGADTWKMIQGPSQTYYWGVPLVLTSATTINSVGVYADADPGDVTLYIDDIDIGIGVIKVDDAQEWTFSGAGMNQTILILADGSNMPLFYVTADGARIEKMSIDGRGVHQDVIDGCTTIYYHGADHVTTSEVFLYDVKGTAIKHRDLSYGDVLYCRGSNIENPFVSGSSAQYIRALGCTSDTITDDDHYWFTSGSDHIEVGSCTMKTGSSGGIRVSTGAGVWYDLNFHDNIIEDMTTQFIQIDGTIYGVRLAGNWCNLSQAVGYRLTNVWDFKILGDHIGFTKQHGVYIITCNDGVVADTTFESINYDDAGSYDGVRHSSHNVTWESNVFVDYSHGGGNQSMNRCIREDGTPEENVYFGNQFRAHRYSPAVTVVASDSVFSMNPGFITENSGTQTCANNEDIAHGLVGTPTWIAVTPMNDTYDSVPVIATVDWSNVDGTNIQVGLYWTNGTAIADDVIFVSWYTKYEP